MALLKQMPDDDLLFVGDLNDRGRRTKEVIEFVMNNPRAKCLKSNHGSMMIAMYNLINGTNYPCGNYDMESLLHPKNGCIDTARSYGGMEFVPKEVIEWLVDLPWYYQDDKLFVSHAPWHHLQTLEQSCDLEGFHSLLWNRNVAWHIDPVNPPPLPLAERDRFQIYGHNGFFLEHKNADGKLYGMCIDDSRNKVLTGVHWPTLEVFEQPYLTYY